MTSQQTSTNYLILGPLPEPQKASTDEIIELSKDAGGKGGVSRNTVRKFKKFIRKKGKIRS